MAPRQSNLGNLREKSKLDKRIDATSNVCQATKIVSLATSVFKRSIDELQDGFKRGMNAKEQRQVSKKLHLSLDAFSNVVPTMSESAKSTAPIPHLRYGMQRWSTFQRQEARMLADITNHGRTNEQSVSAAVVELQNIVKPPAQIRKSLPRGVAEKKSATQKKSTTFEAPTLPTPNNGKVYTLTEAYHILKAVDGRTRGATIAEMIAKKMG